ncbi:hsp20/alpha crystallin family domain-containing protein [Ditylenchus destructor]|uniref:Hsp20/alpha crystallin family domain-containing protein n=1 Tax=Ditylenchus destructor TaxID=166010 RepID=A0AAD4R4V4_9BILA|nr:hsp20/alpha crystallin family domain-containing protein [Ditylenchus destructor]
MALISAFDDFFYPQSCYRIRPRYVPLIHNDGLFSSMLNDTFGELQRLERELGQLTQDTQKGDHFSFKCNVAGYRPEELQVDLQGDQLVIQGEHQHNDERQSVHRTFKRMVALPDTVHKDTIECSIDEKGRLEVRAQNKALEQDEQKRNIPIGFRQNQDQNVVNGQEQPKQVEQKKQ